MMWKLFTGIIAEEIYSHLESNNILPVEQKGCRKKSRGTKDQLIIEDDTEELQEENDQFVSGMDRL